MIHRYAWPRDDEIQHSTVTVTAEHADPAYPASNLAHWNPALPAKLTTLSGDFIVDFGGPTTITAAVILYHNIDHDLTCRLDWSDSGDFNAPDGSASFVMPGDTEDNYAVSPWIEFDPVSARYWRLAAVDAENPAPISVGRLMLLSTLRTLDTDVRWGEEESEEHGIIEMPTEAGVETIYALGGKRRRFEGQLTLSNPTADEFITLARHARTRIHPWLLIPDASRNDAWIVRFEENKWSRQREIIDVNNFPFRVQELARGVPWPS